MNKQGLEKEIIKKFFEIYLNKKKYINDFTYEKYIEQLNIINNELDSLYSYIKLINLKWNKKNK